MISLIIPIYNGEIYLNECLSSVSLQTYKKFEVICIDDGSTDNSSAICKKWCSIDNRFKYIRQNNAGVSAARNLGIENARGDFICFIDADDYLDINYLEELSKNIDNHDAVLCDFTRNKGLGREGNVREISPQLLIYSVIFERIKHPGLYCFLYKTNVINSNMIRFSVGCIKNEDTEFYIHYLAVCKNKIAITSYVGYYYRFNSSSVMASPLSIKSLTSIEASRRINKMLFNSGILGDDMIILHNGILTYAYSIAKSHNLDLCNYLHNKYDVRSAMKKMLLFPRFSKKSVAAMYLILGKRMFYYIIGFLNLL